MEVTAFTTIVSECALGAYFECKNWMPNALFLPELCCLPEAMNALASMAGE